ncbi:hypothetical protein [Actinacidiphila bryophytorum]|uniref:Uncharacterized protein n=1 Tax=Actinacidiphila bryophytorum TaxID=1436133 RepID=A0A9W4GZZ8_9ACTN|nr:hypothetical protein [Actinacidiphila bryophytorum]MBM9434320.1 hypothetical protein [Actinacidiphila bryophytorum]MBN6545935.1 hypothetical protein [Actinacidiphila bryophytorum]CAG7624735.1 conserved exported hypothetical protein [Actinacidiphila bryophytorum]
MFGLKLPVIAAAGALGVLAVGGVTGLPKQALADEGGGGSSSSSSSSSSSASSSSGMDISPATVAPGGVVSLHLKASCKSGAKAKASAEVFVDAVTLAPSGDGSDGWDGTAFIKSDAVDGSYAVSVECNGSTSSASATVTVTSGSTPLVPVNPVPAGGGGTAQLAAGPAAAGTSTGPLLATGGAAAAGLAGLVIRRRTAARG